MTWESVLLDTAKCFTAVILFTCVLYVWNRLNKED